MSESKFIRSGRSGVTDSEAGLDWVDGLSNREVYEEMKRRMRLASSSLAALETDSKRALRAISAESAEAQ